MNTVRFNERVEKNHLKFLNLDVNANDVIKSLMEANIGLNAMLSFAMWNELEYSISNTLNLSKIEVN